MSFYPVVVHNDDVFEVHVAVEIIFSRWKAILGKYLQSQSFGRSLVRWLLEGFLETINIDKR